MRAGYAGAALLFLCAVLLSSCASAPVPEPLPDAADSSGVPLFVYSEPGLKIECEDMMPISSDVLSDGSASGGACVSFPRAESSLTAQVVFPAGRYECLVMERAESTDFSFLVLSFDGARHLVYPSNPPLGVWELTTRTPVYVSFSGETAATVSLFPDEKKKSASETLCADYIQFVRMKDEPLSE